MKKIIFLCIISCAVSAKGFSQLDPKGVKEQEVTEPPLPLKKPALPFSEDSLFSRVEEEANFPGGTAAFKRYLEINLNGEVPLKRKAPPGIYTVVVRFIVGIDGRISDVTAETNKGYGMEEEVIRIIKRSPNWMPARINGIAVRAYRRQPVNFSIDK